MFILSEESIHLCFFLRERHRGRQNAASSKELEVALCISGRTLREHINKLRIVGYPICSETDGYYYASTVNELNDTIARLDSLSEQIGQASDGLRRGRGSSLSDSLESETQD
ncbi:MAG: hypothetical protein RSD35_08115 [Oscillospiraceae bacterium]